MLKEILDDAKEKLKEIESSYKGEISKLRTGRASVSILDGIMVDYYGSMTPLNQVSSVNTPDAHTIFIKPWEKTLIQEIERSIANSDLGFNPQNDGEQVIINVPALTEERRRDLVRQVKDYN